MPNADWHYAIGDQQMPPVSLEGLQDLIRSGTLKRQDRVWTAGMPQWSAAGDLPALAQLFSQPNTPQAPMSMGTPMPMPAPMPLPSPAPISGMPLPGFPAMQPYNAALQYQTPAWAHAQYIHYAGFWRRVAAYLIDAIIVWIGQSALVLAVGANPLQPTFGPNGTGLQPNIMTAKLAGLILVWLYNAFMESSNLQATLGKMALDIKVTNLEGGRISFGQATGRHFGKIISGLIFCIGFMMAGWTERKQALHDMMANTLVVCNS
jgi:uncharacterized RDD family membrane protein YckC